MGKKENLEAARNLVKMYEDFLVKYPKKSFKSIMDFCVTFSKETGFGSVFTCSLCKAAGLEQVKTKEGSYWQPQCQDCIHSVGLDVNSITDSPCVFTVGYRELWSSLVPVEDKYLALADRIKALKELIKEAEKEWEVEING